MSRVFVIAEAGVNHNGDIRIAKRLIDAAKEAGADAVKFQTFKTELLVSKTAEKAAYQKATTGSEETQFEMLKKLELDRAAHHELVGYCETRGIEFLSTAFDPESVELLHELGMRIWKIPSGEITNLPYLRRVGSLGKEILISTGMASLGEVEAALEAVVAVGARRSDITVLHCTTEYPAPFEEVNLRAMVMMGEVFGVAYGYSDHTKGIAVPISAAALGASVIEKHFTLDRNMSGPDHKASLEPGELAAMVEGIRTVEVALGDGMKRPSAAEISNRAVARRSIVAARRIARGEVLSVHDLAVKRPGTGISPMDWDQVVGTTAQHDYEVDEAIRW